MNNIILPKIIDKLNDAKWHVDSDTAMCIEAAVKVCEDVYKAVQEEWQRYYALHKHITLMGFEFEEVIEILNQYKQTHEYCEKK